MKINPWDYNDRDQENIVNIFNERKKKVFDNFNGNMPGKLPIFVALIILLLIWISSGITIVQPEEEAIILRFGKYDRTLIPGLHFHLPTPIEKSIKVKITAINKEEIGYRSTSNGRREISSESMMLTGDENIISVFFEIQWKINDGKKYLFNVHDDIPGTTVRISSESVMREIIGKKPIEFILTGEGRTEMSHESMASTQRVLDEYDAGITISSVQMQKIDPPESVIASFRDVQSAKADREREINQSVAYRNDIIPKTRGSAERIMQEAEAYKQEAIKKAEGESQRFIMICDEYNKFPAITKNRMHIDALESSLENINKIVIDGKTGSTLPHFSLQDFMKKNNYGNPQ